MILRRCFLAVLVESLRVVLGGSAAFLPDLALAFAIQSGLRARREEDLSQAVVIGAAAGLVVDGAWLIVPLRCLLAAATATFVRRQLMPGRVRMAPTLVSVIVMLSVVFDVAVRSLMPGVDVSLAWLSLRLAAMPATVLMVLIFDSGAELRERMAFR